jgi:hypothetical protein
MAEMVEIAKSSIWIFKINHRVWLASLNPYIAVPVGFDENGTEAELKTGIRVPFPTYSSTDIIVSANGRQLIPWTADAYLDVSELNIDKKNRG